MEYLFVTIANLGIVVGIVLLVIRGNTYDFEDNEREILTTVLLILSFTYVVGTSLLLVFVCFYVVSWLYNLEVVDNFMNKKKKV